MPSCKMVQTIGDQEAVYVQQQSLALQLSTQRLYIWWQGHTPWQESQNAIFLELISADSGSVACQIIAIYTLV